jgi:spore coat protein U-like protein
MSRSTAHRSRAWSRALAFASVLLLAPATAHAAGCTISTTSIAFGPYDVFSAAPVDSTATITYRCNGNSSVAIGITSGQSDTFNPRVMTKGLERLGYHLFLDPAHTAIWGDTGSGTQMYYDPGAPNNRSVTVTVYGRIPAGQDVSAGSYTDSVVALVLF